VFSNGLFKIFWIYIAGLCDKPKNSKSYVIANKYLGLQSVVDNVMAEADDGGNGDGATAGDCYAHHHYRDVKLARDASENIDSISSLPDVILQQILSSLPTNLAIRTSVLSTRWRHVWSDTPYIYFDGPGTLYRGLKADTINKTLARYKLPKIMSFHLYTKIF